MSERRQQNAAWPQRRDLLVNLSRIDLDSLALSREQIREINPQRYENENLHGVIWFDRAEGLLVGFRDVREDEFWVRGHLPGRPLLPGALMVEAAAQLASVGYKLFTSRKDSRFFGFAGIRDFRFRRPVAPPARLLLLGKSLQARKRLAVFHTQGVANGALVFEGTILGMPM